MVGHQRRGEALVDDKYSKGRFVYIASADNPKLIRAVADYYTGKIPLQISDPAKQVVLVWQKEQNRYVLHIIDQGNFEVRIQKKFAEFSKITSQYRQSGWSPSIKQTKDE